MSQPASTFLDRYTVLSSLLGLALILILVVIWSRLPSKPSSSAEPKNLTTSQEPEGLLPPLSIESAVDLAREAIAAKSTEEVERLFHLGEHEPSDVLDYLKDLKLPEPAEIKIRWVLHGSGVHPYEGVVIQWTEKGKLRARLAPVMLGDTGIWKVDFAVFACICTPTWDEILEGQVTEATVRALMRLDNYFNHPFWDDEWHCFRLTWLEHEQPLYGYVRKGSAQDKALGELLLRSKRKASSRREGRNPRLRAMLGLKRPEGALINQFEIVRVLASDWVEEAQPYDEPFGAP